MDVYAVAGADGSGKTATAVNVAVAFRAAGQHAAVLDADISDNVTSLLGIDPATTLDDVLHERMAVREATTEYQLSDEAVPEDDLLAYRQALAEDRTTFRSSDEDLPGVEETDFPDVDSLPVIAGWPSERRIAAADPTALEDVLQELVMAYDAVVIDTGGESVAATAPVAVADGVAIVTSPDEAHIQTSNSTAIECQRNGAPLIGTVINRANDRTNVTEVTDQVGVEVAGVVPSDDRTRGLEPVRYSVPDAPAAKAYDRLADSLADWSRTVASEASSAADGGGPGASTSGDTATTEETAGDGEATSDDGDDEEGGGGLFSRFTDDD
jgi:MinD-like ATPase involved in chromosome partitioning or flagellar assembly